MWFWWPIAGMVVRTAAHSAAICSIVQAVVAGAQMLSIASGFAYSRSRDEFSLLMQSFIQFGA